MGCALSVPKERPGPLASTGTSSASSCGGSEGSGLRPAKPSKARASVHDSAEQQHAHGAGRHGKGMTEADTLEPQGPGQDATGSLSADLSIDLPGRTHRSVERSTELASPPARATATASKALMDASLAIRSSFAVDVGLGSHCADAALGPKARAARSTQQRLRQQPSRISEAESKEDFAPPPHLAPYYRALAALPADLPVPLGMLKHLWGLESEAAAQKVAEQFHSLGVVRMAALEDGSAWCLVVEGHLAACQERFGSAVQQSHCALLDGYTENGLVPLESVADDGYIMQAMAHHLIGASRLDGLLRLLSDPSWLEAKLHAYGIAPVVSDFRKYLACRDEASTKLLLQAFQLSLSCCMEQPSSRMLREQMLGRLVTVAEPGSADAHEIMTTTSSADCAMGQVTLQQLALARGTGAGRDSDVATIVALRGWYKQQVALSAADMSAAAGYALVHLLPVAPSLEQAGGLQRMTLRGHAGPIRQVLISPNGADVITVSEDGSAQVWDMNVGDCVMQLGRDQPLTCADVTPGGNLACVASADGNCCVWEISTGKVLHVLRGHTAKVNAVCIDRQGLRCVTASDDGTVRVWSIADGRCEQVLQGHGVGGYGVVFDVAISTDGTLAATVSEDFSCRVWDLDEETCLHVLEGHSGWVTSVRFIGTTANVITASHDGNARIWDGERGVCLHVLSGHTGRLNRVVVDSGGSYGVTCSDDNTARVWDLDSGACLCVLEGHGAWVNDAVVSKDAKRVVTVSGDGLGRVWDTRTGQVTLLLQGHSGPIRRLVLTARGRFAVTASDDCTARVWDLLAPPTDQGVAPTLAQGSRIKSMVALPGGKEVVSAAEDGSISVWDTDTISRRHRIEAHGAAIQYLSATSHPSRVVSGSGDRQVCVWDAATGARLHQLARQQGSRVKHMAFSQDGLKAAIVLFDSSMAVWDLATGTVLAQLMSRAERSGRNVHSGGVNGVLLTADGRLAVSWSKDCTARIWDVARNEVACVVDGHTDGLRCAMISQDETMLATASYLPVVRVNRMNDGSPLAVLEHESPACSVLFSPDNRYLAAILETHQVVVWDLVAHSCLAPLDAHKQDINCAVFSPDSSMLATCSSDCTLRVWDPATGRQIAFFMGDAAITSACFAGHPDVSLVVAGDVRGATHFLNCPPELHPANSSSY